ncbi:MAG TPA: crotonase/enoyl-CoA hydratase family protein [Solirubrobacteraceae bacterium]|jgi:enoyl-CoA hydratase/carnithine racemase|nr:crotonase/enoyl-CoA hydratase family protein [Solirubrobacteraceae bacterium]
MSQRPAADGERLAADGERLAADGERVAIRLDEHIAVVTLTRPDKHNALDLAMLDAIIAAAERLRGEAGVRAVVLHGAGKSFCSGLDFPAVAAAGGLEAFMGILDEPSPNYFQRAGHGWIDLPVPVIAAIHGNCLGGGLQIALAADIRIAAPDARLSVMEGRWGLIPDMSITRTLPRLVGIDVAKELTITARTIDAAEADRLGLITHLDDDPLTAAIELAREIAERSPDAVRRAKRLFNDGWTGSADQTLALEAELQGELIGTPNQLAAMTAAMTKQAAQFTDP